MLRDRAILLRQLLHSEGKLLVHIGDALAAHVRALFDEVFSGLYRNTIIVRRGTKNVQAQFETITSLAVGCDYIRDCLRIAPFGKNCG
jgi:adenine-specific DNA-methyltransferase